MRKLFYLALAGLVLFEFLRTYLVMPMPGSQTGNTVQLAYSLYYFRWFFRVILGLVVLASIPSILANKWKWAALFCLVIVIGAEYLLNFQMAADKMFLQPTELTFNTAAQNKLAQSRIIIGVENNGEAKAYPVEYLTYHHQVKDTIGGKPILVTYCSVCRTGRVYDPIIDGKLQTFRLVGMDHFNAMFEDVTTHSWWRQATGEAVAGKMKGKVLKEIDSRQMTVGEWFQLYPNGKVMGPDKYSVLNYDSAARFEQGKSRGSLTRTDSLSWQNKSWVVGVKLQNSAKAYDWNDLKKFKVIDDVIGSTPVVLVLSQDGQSFVAYQRPAGENFKVRNDTIFSDSAAYDFAGHNLFVAKRDLKPINAYQEFWHSWSTFHPGTLKYESH